MAIFIPFNQDVDPIFPSSVDDWLPEGHLARYIVQVVKTLDLSEIEGAYSKGGSAAYPPVMMISLLIYAYATGVFSTRQIERATYESAAFRYLAGNHHPDHDTLAAFRRRFGEQFKALFVQVLQIAQVNKISQFGTVSLDGTKVHANASRHSALSYDHASKIEAQLTQEVKELLELAKIANKDNIPEGLIIPAEITRREEQIEAIKIAKTKIEDRAKERYQIEKAEFDAKIKERAEKEEKRGRKLGGSKPTPPVETPLPHDQINLTDEESRIMKTPNGFEQSYNAQAAVDVDSMLIVAINVTQAVNDKQQIEPMLKEFQILSKDIATPTTLLGDTGFFSENNVNACIEAGVEPLIASGREGHHPHWKERFSEPEPLPEGATPVEKMKHKLKTQAGKKIYAKRKHTVEPVFGIIKSVMGFRQFMLRGLENAKNEWTLVCLAWNLKRMAILRPNLAE